MDDGAGGDLVAITACYDSFLHGRWGMRTAHEFCLELLNSRSWNKILSGTKIDFLFSAPLDLLLYLGDISCLYGCDLKRSDSGCRTYNLFLMKLANGCPRHEYLRVIFLSTFILGLYSPCSQVCYYSLLANPWFEPVWPLQETTRSTVVLDVRVRVGGVSMSRSTSASQAELHDRGHEY